MKFKYDQLLTSIATPCYNVVIGMHYKQDNVAKYFVIFPDGSSRLLREDVIERHFEKVV